MKKSQILFIMLVSCLFVLPVTIFSNPNLISAEEVKLMPMELNGTEWEVTMTNVTKKGKKKTNEDKLIFLDKKFISEKFDKKGYEPTNYSATIQDDGATKFGTMQIKGKDTSFWKGIIKGGTIDGSVHTQFRGGDSTRRTYFKGTLVTGELKRKAERKPTPPPPPAPVPAPAVEIEESSNSVMEETKETVGGVIEKTQDLVNSDDGSMEAVPAELEVNEAKSAE